MEGQYPSLYNHKVHEEKKTKNSEFRSETNSESNLETAQRPNIVDRPRLSQSSKHLTFRKRLSIAMREPIEGALSTVEKAYRQTKQSASAIWVSTYLLYPNTLCKFHTNTKELKKLHH